MRYDKTGSVSYTHLDVYKRQDYTFTSTGSAGLGVSNEITAETAEICVKSGVFILIESSDQPKKFEIL